MKNKKIVFGIIVLLIVFLIPFGRGAKTGTKYLGNFGDYVAVSLNAQEGDVIRGDYRTYSSPFDVGIGWEFLEWVDTFTTYYEEGWFELTITSGSGTIYIVLMNADFYAGGYIEYTVSNPKGEAREQEAIMMGIIISIIVVIVSVCIIVGIAVHFKNKKKKRETEIQVQETIKPKSFYCSNCGIESIDITRDYCSNCGSKIIK